MHNFMYVLNHHSSFLFLNLLFISITAQVLNYLTERRLHPSLSVLYGPHLAGQLTIAHAHLMITIASTIYAIPADCNQEYVSVIISLKCTIKHSVTECKIQLFEDRYTGIFTL